MFILTIEPKPNILVETNIALCGDGQSVWNAWFYFTGNKYINDNCNMKIVDEHGFQRDPNMGIHLPFKKTGT